MTEFEARMQAQAVEMVLNVPSAVALALLVKPMTEESDAKAVRAMSSAVNMAIRDPGALVRIACDCISDAILVSGVLDKLCRVLKNARLVAEKSTKTFFELENGSAIFIALNVSTKGIDIQ